MKILSAILFCALLSTTTGCPVAYAYELKDEKKCVIDKCEKNTCSVETPEGIVDIKKKTNYEEGKKVICPRKTFRKSNL